MVFGKIIGAVGVARLPKDVKLSLSDTIPDPIEAHVDGFRLFLFDGVIGDAASSAVVGLKRCGWLRVAKFIQGNAYGTNGLCIQE